MFPSFQSCGRSPESRDFWNIMVMGLHIIAAISFRTLGWTESGPGLFEILSLFSFFSTSFWSIIKSGNFLSVLSGISISGASSSFVNSETNFLFSISAFSWSPFVVSSQSSSRKRSGTFTLILVCLPTYCQNFLGFFLHLSQQISECFSWFFE